MENLLFFGVPKFGGNYNLNIFSLNIGTPKTIDFPFGTNGKSMILSVPILKHFRVCIFVGIIEAFGVETILVYTALLLKKRIAVYFPPHSVEDLLQITR